MIKINIKILRILQSCKLETPVARLYRNFKTLPIHKLHELYILAFMHKHKHDRVNLPFVFHEYCIENFNIPAHSTRQSNNYHKQLINKSIGQKTPKTKGCKLWNELPYLLQLCKGLFTFKSKKKNKLLLEL